MVESGEKNIQIIIKKMKCKYHKTCKYYKKNSFTCNSSRENPYCGVFRKKENDK